jgi:ferrous iron transport protein B
METTIALVGNPNSGKTTLFNQLTGNHQYVGNWPGVTVERKTGHLKSDKNIQFVDLPGIYSLSPYSSEEVISRNYLVDGNPDVIINIVDASNLERNLYLTTQLMEFGIPVVVALNLMDIVKKHGYTIKSKELSEQLQVPVVEISALRGDGLEDLVATTVKAAHAGIAPQPVTFAPELETALAAIEDKLPGIMPADKRRYYAIKLFERDQKAIDELGAKVSCDDIILEAESLFDDSSDAIITNERYRYIEGFIKRVHKRALTGATVSEKIDSVLTNRILALPIFVVVIALIYYISISTVGTYATDWANDGVFGDGWYLDPVAIMLGGEPSDTALWIPGIPVLIGTALEAVGCVGWLYDLIMDGIVAGVGAVLGFVPQIMILFFLLAILEACGYMARVTFILDRLFRRFGLSGKTFVPMIVGTGCGVPGIMASRTIESESARRLTVMTTTFMPCSAKLPIIALIATAVFGGVWWVAPLAYFMGIAAIIVSGIILRKTRPFMGKVTPYVMELPEYRLPRFVDLLRSMWDRAWGFIKKAGTIILLATIVVWFLSGYGIYEGQFMWVGEELMDHSFLAYFGNAFAWVFAPLGFGNWECASTVVTGLIAKENVISTMAIVYGGDPNMAWTSAYMASLAASAGSVALVSVAAFAFMTFQLLCAPCFAAMGAIKGEMGGFNKWFWAAIAWECGFAYVISLIIFQLGAWVVTGVFSLGTIVGLLFLVALLWMLFRPASKPAAPEQTNTAVKAAA